MNFFVVYLSDIESSQIWPLLIEKWMGVVRGFSTTTLMVGIAPAADRRGFLKFRWSGKQKRLQEAGARRRGRQ
jgi:hypothetical protein